MKEYIKNVIPRIQQYSKGLNKIEILVEPQKPWIHYDEKGNQHQYIFMRDGRLLMIFNGVTKTGKWELLHTNQLLIDRISDQITLEHLFVEKALLILKLSGTTHQPFILINPLEIPDLDVLAYLKKIEIERKGIPPDYKKPLKPLIEDETDLLAKSIGLALLGFLIIFMIATATK